MDYYKDWNYKIKKEADKNQVGYEPEEEEEEPNIIKRVSVYVTDKKGNVLSDVTIIFDEKEFTIGRYGLLIANLPNEANSITAEKEGYKSATAEMILDAKKQSHEFFLALSESDEESEVISTDETIEETENDERFQIGEVLFEPPLDGTDEITAWSGTNKTYDGTYEGRGSFLTDGWSNEGLWQLEYDVKYEKSGPYGYVGTMPICSAEIKPFTDAKLKDYAFETWEGTTCIRGLEAEVSGPINYKYTGRNFYHHAVIKKVAENKLEFYFDEKVWYITAPKLANLTTLHIGMRDNPYDRQWGEQIYYQNIKVYSLLKPNQNNNTPSQNQQEGPSLDSINTETMTEEEGEF